MKKIKIIFYSTLVILIVTSCGSEKSPLAKYGIVFENVMRSENGVFRGFSLGNMIDSVKQKEAEPVEVDDNYLYYEYEIDTQATYSVAYSFEDGLLDEIRSFVFVNDNTKTEQVLSSFKNYFTQHYGEFQEHMGFYVWSVKSEKYGLVRINLSDESADFSVENAPGKISIWIYPETENN